MKNEKELKYEDNGFVVVFKKEKEGYQFTVAENENISGKFKETLIELQQNLFSRRDVERVARCIFTAIKTNIFIKRNYNCFETLVSKFEKEYEYPIFDTDFIPIGSFKWYWCLIENVPLKFELGTGEGLTRHEAKVNVLLNALNISYDETI